jgi:hypothetical protein
VESPSGLSALQRFSISGLHVVLTITGSISHSSPAAPSGWIADEINTT